MGWALLNACKKKLACTVRLGAYTLDFVGSTTRGMLKTHWMPWMVVCWMEGSCVCKWPATEDLRLRIEDILDVREDGGGKVFDSVSLHQHEVATYLCIEVALDDRVFASTLCVPRYTLSWRFFVDILKIVGLRVGGVHVVNGGIFDSRI